MRWYPLLNGDPGDPPGPEWSSLLAELLLAAEAATDAAATAAAAAAAAALPAGNKKIHLMSGILKLPATQAAGEQQNSWK